MFVFGPAKFANCLKRGILDYNFDSDEYLTAFANSVDPDQLASE